MDIKLNAPTMDRRSFLKASAAAAATLGRLRLCSGATGVLLRLTVRSLHLKVPNGRRLPACTAAEHVA